MVQIWTESTNGGELLFLKAVLTGAKKFLKRGRKTASQEEQVRRLCPQLFTPIGLCGHNLRPAQIGLVFVGDLSPIPCFKF